MIISSTRMLFRTFTSPELLPLPGDAAGLTVGSAYVDFREKADAERVRRALDGRSYGGRRVTAVVLGEQIADDLPYNDYNEYYAPDFSLNVTPNASMENSNTRQYLDSIKQQVHENLRMLQGAPGVAMEQLPPNLELPPEPEADPDARGGGGSSSAPQHPAEHYDDD